MAKEISRAQRKAAHAKVKAAAQALEEIGFKIGKVTSVSGMLEAISKNKNTINKIDSLVYKVKAKDTEEEKPLKSLFEDSEDEDEDDLLEDEDSEDEDDLLEDEDSSSDELDEKPQNKKSPKEKQEPKVETPKRKVSSSEGTKTVVDKKVVVQKDKEKLADQKELNKYSSIIPSFDN